MKTIRNLFAENLNRLLKIHYVFLIVIGLRKKITFILKSGKTISVYTSNFKITYRGNELTGYSLEDGTGKLFYLRIDEIAAILQ